MVRLRGPLVCEHPAVSFASGGRRSIFCCLFVSGLFPALFSGRLGLPSLLLTYVHYRFSPPLRDHVGWFSYTETSKLRPVAGYDLR